jgi:hypothetical protein
MKSIMIKKGAKRLREEFETQLNNALEKDLVVDLATVGVDFKGRNYVINNLFSREEIMNATEDDVNMQTEVDAQKDKVVMADRDRQQQIDDKKEALKIALNI